MATPRISISGVGDFDLNMEEVEHGYQNTWSKVGEFKAPHHLTDIWEQGSDEDFTVSIEVVAGVSATIQTSDQVVKFLAKCKGIAIYDPLKVAGQQAVTTVSIGDWFRKSCVVISVRPVAKGPWDSSSRPMVGAVTFTFRPVGSASGGAALTPGTYSFSS